MELFLVQDENGEYADDFETRDKAAAIDYARANHLKVERIFYVEAGSEIIEDFTGGGR